MSGALGRVGLAAAVAALLAGPAFAGQAAPGRTIAVTNVRIVPVTAPDIPSGTILIKDGRITALGAGIAVPAGADVLDAAGLIAYPGMIDACCQLGLSEVSGVPATVDLREAGRINPQVRAIEALRYDSVHIPIARANGITAALVAPSGGLISGMSCLVRLDGRTNREMLVKSPAAMHVELPAIRSGRGGFGGGMGRGGEARVEAPQLLEELHALFGEARAYEKRKIHAASNPLLAPPGFDETAEALLPVLRGDIPVMISVHADKDIRAALEFVKSEGVRAVFFGVEQGWKAAKAIAAANIPCVLDSMYAMPPLFEDGYDAIFRNPGVLHAAGVKIAFASASSSAAKDLPYHAAKAAAFGLDKRAALEAVTIRPAEIFGLDSSLGSLEAGKCADIVLADGDILELRTNIKHVFIRGRAVDLSNRYTELLDRFDRDTEDR